MISVDSDSFNVWAPVIKNAFHLDGKATAWNVPQGRISADQKSPVVPLGHLGRNSPQVLLMSPPPTNWRSYD
jgi:hypothetical protein